LVDQFEIDGAKNRIKWFNADESRKQRFAFVWKKFLREGQIKVGDKITNPEQAAALKLIARDGADAFYKGEIASAIGNAVRNDGGVLTSEDLAGYQHREVEPLKYREFGRDFLGMPPPSSGGTTIGQFLLIFTQSNSFRSLALSRAMMLMQGASSETTTINGAMVVSGALVNQAMNVTWPIEVPETIEGVDSKVIMRFTEQLPPFGWIRQHELVESMKHAFADRARWLADPQFSEVPTEKLISRKYARTLAARIKQDQTLPADQYGSATAIPDDSGTSHLCVIDKHGNAVACTETINLSYGSKLAVPEFGFCLNNEMDDFTTRRGVANDFGLVQSERNMPQPGKRPLSSMSPTIVLNQDGSVFMIAGASGGPRIITGTAQAMLKVLIENATAAEAVGAPRIHHQWQPDVLEYEKGALSEQNIEELKKRGHKVMPAKEDVGNVQLIRRSKDGKGWDAACDPRKGGRPAGH
ncbi:MAG TPA: gamma-glutamyltransferase, partial [Tepidisphaeraceae bacterium]|nr:gamma-glutamyltransferase [Tepidisphaeraceae bacterium]